MAWAKLDDQFVEHPRIALVQRERPLIRRQCLRRIVLLVQVRQP